MREKEFGTSWVAENRAVIKNFPGDFLENEEVKELELPGDVLVLGPEIFGSFEILNSVGEAVLTVQNIHNAKYILYANRHKPESIKMPVDDEAVKASVKKYEKYLDELLAKIKKDFDELFPKSSKLKEIINYIFVSLNLKRY